MLQPIGDIEEGNCRAGPRFGSSDGARPARVSPESQSHTQPKGDPAADPDKEASAQPKASATTWRPASASARLRRMTSGQPPGSNDPTKRMASGTVSAAVGS